MSILVLPFRIIHSESPTGAAEKIYGEHTVINSEIGANVVTERVHDAIKVPRSIEPQLALALILTFFSFN